MPLVRCFRSKKFEDKEGETRSTGATLWGRNRDRVEHDAVFGLLRDENGGVAQLVRAHGSYPWRHWFKSSHRYQEFHASHDAGRLMQYSLFP